MPAPFKTLALAAGLGLAVAACDTVQQGASVTKAGAGTCGADTRQEWVGQSVAILNDVELPDGARLLLPTTPATMDYRPDRLNVEVNASDSIVRVYCG